MQPPASRHCSIALLLSRLKDSSSSHGRIRCTTSLNLLTTRTRPNPKVYLRRTWRPQLTDTAVAAPRSQAGPWHQLHSQPPLPGRNSTWNPHSFRILFLSQAPIAFVCSFLPVWPSSRRPWPPPCNVRDSRVFWTPQLGLGECGSTRVSRGHRACPGERLCAGHGPSRLQPAGRARLEVVVDGLPLWNGAQLAIDTTMVSLVRRDGCARAGTATTDGKALDVARTQKARRYPELSGENGTACLVVMGTEVGGRWSAEAATFLCGFATAKARDAPFRGWQGMLECAAARAFAQSVLEGPAAGGVDGPSPSMNAVLGDARFG